MRNQEHLIAMACMQWWAYWSRARGIDERLLFAVPNGGHRFRAVAGKLKAEGVRAGIPDYFLAIPRASAGLHGLFIELKSPDGRLSPVQDEMIQVLNRSGYASRVCFGTEEFISTVEKYLS